MIWRRSTGKISIVHKDIPNRVVCNSYYGKEDSIMNNRCYNSKQKEWKSMLSHFPEDNIAANLHFKAVFEKYVEEEGLELFLEQNGYLYSNCFDELFQELGFNCQRGSPTMWIFDDTDIPKIDFFTEQKPIV